MIFDKKIILSYKNPFIVRRTLNNPVTSLFIVCSYIISKVILINYTSVLLFIIQNVAREISHNERTLQTYSDEKLNGHFL